MDTAAIAIPIPVQPIEPQQPAPGKDGLPAEGESSSDTFATALEQQIAQTAAGGAHAAHLKLPVTNTEEKPGTAGGSEPRDPATPDDLIAMMAAPLFAQASQAASAAQPRASAESPAALTAAHADDKTSGQRPGERDIAMPRQTAKPFELAAAADTQHAARSAEPDPAPAPLPSALMADAASAPLPATSHMLSAPVHAAAPAPVHEPRIDARVGSAEWGNGLAQQVTVMVKDGEHTAQLRLDPPDLGPLEVRLSMARNEDGVAHAQFVSPHAAVRDALEAALPQLRAVLADNGITLGQASVGEGYAREDGRQSSSGSGNNARGNDAMGPIAASRVIVRHGLVDTFA